MLDSLHITFGSPSRLPPISKNAYLPPLSFFLLALTQGWRMKSSRSLQRDDLPCQLNMLTYFGRFDFVRFGFSIIRGGASIQYLGGQNLKKNKIGSQNYKNNKI